MLDPITVFLLSWILPGLVACWMALRNWGAVYEVPLVKARPKRVIQALTEMVGLGPMALFCVLALRVVDKIERFHDHGLTLRGYVWRALVKPRRVSR